MLKLAAAAGLMAGCVFAFAGSVAGADGPPKGLALLATAPVNVDGSSDGIATFGGAMPSAPELDGMRALGLRVQAFPNLPLALLQGPRGHEHTVIEGGLTEDHVHDAVRIAATISATAVALEMVEATAEVTV